MSEVKVKLREGSQGSRWARMANDVVSKNKDRGGWVSRHAIAWGFIYALLDIADAIRSLGDHE